MKRNLLIIILLSVLPTACLQRYSTISLGPALPLTGTFTDIRYSETLKGLEGVEIRIVMAGDSFEATVQFAAGDPLSLVVMPVQMNSEDSRLAGKVEEREGEEARLRFELPQTSPRPGVFSGLITRTHLEGTFRFRSGEVWS